MLLVDNIHLINRSMRVSNLHGNRMKIREDVCVYLLMIYHFQHADRWT